MYKKTITYQTYDDVPETIVEDFYFNIDKTELLELNLGIEGGLEEYVNDMVIKRDVPKLSEFFRSLVLKGLGERTADKKGFRKSPEIVDRFVCSDAYNVLMWELLTGENGEALEFLQNVFPKQVDANGKVISLDVNKAIEERAAKDPVFANVVEKAKEVPKVDTNADN